VLKLKIKMNPTDSLSPNKVCFKSRTNFCPIFTYLSMQGLLVILVVLDLCPY
jgi:hypothetical protein